MEAITDLLQRTNSTSISSSDIQTSSSRCNSPRSVRKSREGNVYTGKTVLESSAKWPPSRVNSSQKVTTPTKLASHKTIEPLGASPPSAKISPSASSSVTKQRNGIPRKTKESLADIGLDIMTTMQECSIDSPTIPGHPPIMRVLNQETRIPPLRPLPRPQNTQVAQEEIYSLYPVPRSVFSDVGQKRASSVLLPKELAPLVIPNSSTDFLSAQTYGLPIPMKGDEDLPPKVPPKSPKTLIRAFPQPGKVRETPISTTSPSSTFGTANSSVTSLGTMDSRDSPRPWTSPIRGRSPLSTKKLVDTSRENARRPSVRKQSETTIVGGTNEPHLKQSRIENSRKGRHVTTTGHQRAESEASILNRSRPMRRYDTTLQRSFNRNLKLQGPMNLFTNELPQGMPLGIASDKLAMCEIRRLKQLAELRTREFKVLNEMEVSNLTRECRELDERCKYLQIFHASLREGRHEISNRIVAILKSPRTATFLREHLIKQEEALLDLDISINEWLTKLNAAEGRRQMVQRKLLEHTAAVIYMAGPPSPRDEVSVHQHTPPRSPQEIEFSPERREVESIRIYADSGVASLLASIEKEIDVLARSTR